MVGKRIGIGFLAVALTLLVSAQSAWAQDEERDTDMIAARSEPPTAAGPGAAAIVESVEGAPKAGVAFLDYVYPDQVIELGRNGVIVLSYFDSCLVETVQGGRLTVQPGASKIAGGRVTTEQVPCQGTQMFVTAATSEAGATVTRLSTDDQDNWSEWTTKSQRPVFKWQHSAAAGAAKVTVFYMDAAPPKAVWQTESEGGHVAYPEVAPELAIGLPYRVEVRLPGGGKVAALFSIDPDLDVPDTAMSRVVPVR